MMQLEKSYLAPLQRIPVLNKLNTNQQGALYNVVLRANLYSVSNFQSITRVLQKSSGIKFKRHL
jgi:lysozyme